MATIDEKMDSIHNYAETSNIIGRITTPELGIPQKEINDPDLVDQDLIEGRGKGFKSTISQLINRFLNRG